MTRMHYSRTVVYEYWYSTGAVPVPRLLCLVQVPGTGQPVHSLLPVHVDLLHTWSGSSKYRYTDKLTNTNESSEEGQDLGAGQQ